MGLVQLIPLICKSIKAWDFSNDQVSKFRALIQISTKPYQIEIPQGCTLQKYDQAYPMFEL